MEVGFLKWGRREWVSFAIIICVLLLHLLVLGYPVLTYDSYRYVPTAIYLSTNQFSLTLVCHLLHPLVSLTGSYGFVLAHMFLLSYALNSVLIHFKKGALVGVSALFLSALGLIACQVMMDAYTVVGLLSLYLILNGRRDVILYLILSVSYIAHYGNVALYPLVALLWWVLFGRKNTRTLATLAVLFLVPIAAVLTSHHLKEQDVRFSPGCIYSYIADFILRDSSEITFAFIRDHPGSQLSRHKSLYDEIVEGKQSRYGILWEKGNLIDRMGGPVGYNGEARGFVWYAIVNHPWTMLGIWSHRTLLFLMDPEFDHVLELSNQRLVLMDIIEMYLPGQRNAAMNSLQYEGKLESTNLRVFTLSYYVSYIVAASLTLLYILHPKYRRGGYYRFTVFVFSIIVLNAVLMSPFELLSRYKVRILLLPCLLLFFIVSDLLRDRRVLDPGDA